MKSNHWLASIFWMIVLLASCKPQDDEPPIIRLNGDAGMVIGRGMVFNDPGVVAFDKNDLDLADRVVVSGNLDIQNIGTYERVYTVTDDAGNSAQVSRGLTVKHQLGSVLGTYRSFTSLGACTSGGTATITVYNSQTNSFQISPALGFTGGSTSWLVASFYSDTQYPIRIGGGRLPCNYSLTSNSGLGQISNDGDTITFRNCIVFNDFTGAGIPVSLTYARL